MHGPCQPMKLFKINQLRWLNVLFPASGKGLEGMLYPAGIARNGRGGGKGREARAPGTVAQSGAYLVFFDSAPPRGQESLDFRWLGSETEYAVQEMNWALFLKKLLTNPAYISPVAALDVWVLLMFWV